MNAPRGERVLSVTLDDCRVDAYRPGGAGGQHRDKTSNAVRVTHKASGAVGQSQESRSQLANKKAAFKRMVETPKFQAWLNMQLGRDMVDKVEMTRRINAQVERDMNPDNIRVETMDEEGVWVDEGSGDR